MRLIDSILLRNGAARIELLEGDLSNIPLEHRVDVLVLSAFPNGYHPSKTSLIGALDRRGLVLRGLADDKEIDLRQNFSCWLSKPLGAEFGDLNFGRVLCFEPHIRGAAPAVVGEVFQALAPFCCGPPNVRSIAMPILAAGDQGNPVSAMLPPMLEGALQWLRHGFPVNTIKIVLRTGSDPALAQELFASAKAEMVRQERIEKQAAAPTYDIFLSYARPDGECAHALADSLSAAGLKVFFDRADMRSGSVWQQQIFDALSDCAAAAVLFSPDYLISPVCKEEFNIAWVRQRESDGFIFPLLVRDAALPPHMRMLNYADCRPSRTDLVRAASVELERRLRETA